MVCRPLTSIFYRSAADDCGGKVEQTGYGPVGIDAGIDHAFVHGAWNDLHVGKSKPGEIGVEFVFGKTCAKEFADLGKIRTDVGASFAVRGAVNERLRDEIEEGDAAGPGVLGDA